MVSFISHLCTHTTRATTRQQLQGEAAAVKRLKETCDVAARYMAHHNSMTQRYLGGQRHVKCNRVLQNNHRLQVTPKNKGSYSTALVLKS